MIWLVAAISSAAVFGFSGFLMKVGTEQKFSPAILLLGLYTSGTIAFLSTILLRSNLQFSPIILLSGIIIGLGSSVGNHYLIRALALGPASLTSPLININIFFVILMSLFFYGESLTLNEYLAIALFILSCCLIPLDPKEKMQIKNKKWYLFIALSVIFVFLRNGGLKITQENGLDNTVILFYGYLLSFLFFLFKTIPNKTNLINNKIGIIIGLLAGVFSYGGLELYSYALKTGPASIVAPIFSLRSVVMLVLAMTIYKERLTIFQSISVLALFLGLFLVAN